MTDAQREADLAAESHLSLLRHFDDAKQMGGLEDLFRGSLKVLAVSKEGLKRNLEYNLDSYDMENFESARGLLRFVVHLPQLGYEKISLMNGAGLADLSFELDGQRWFAEVKTLTLQYTEQRGLAVDKHQPESCNIAEYVEEVTRYLADGRVSKARKQLCSTKEQVGPGQTMFGVVQNWFAADFYLDEAHLSSIYESLRGKRPNWEQDYLQDVDCMAFLIDGRLTRICH